MSAQPMVITDAGSREIRLWWPLPLAVLIWLLIIWAFGYFLSKTEEEVAIYIPDAIEAEFLDLPELPQPQESAPPSSRGVQQPEIPPQLEPPTPRVRPQTPPPSVKPETVTVPEAQPLEEKTATEKERVKEQDTDAPVDLSEYINQRRPQTLSAAPNRTGGLFDGPEYTRNQQTRPQPSAEEARMARVRRNLQTPGTSGVFQLLEMRPRHARFAFRAWTTDISNPRRVTIEVEAGADDDIERAVIRRMIQLIREYHQEDFNWESHRLSRVVVLSARQRDNEGLEDFLMREFFGEPLPPYMR